MVVVETYYYSAVRIAKDNLGSHLYKLIYEEQAALKHLLVYEHRPLRLGGDHQHYAQQVGRKARPRMIVNGEYRSVNKGLYAVTILLWHVDVIAVYFKLNAQAPECFRYHAKVGYVGIFDC